VKRYIVIEMLDHTTGDEAQDFADEINTTFQPHYDAKVVLVSDESESLWK